MRIIFISNDVAVSNEAYCQDDYIGIIMVHLLKNVERVFQPEV